MNTFLAVWILACDVVAFVACGLSAHWARQTAKSVREIKRINGGRM